MWFQVCMAVRELKQERELCHPQPLWMGSYSFLLKRDFKKLFGRFLVL